MYPESPPLKTRELLHTLIAAFIHVSSEMDAYHALESDYQKATQKIFRSERSPSHVTVNVIR
jgi:hypothetical protein